LARSSLFSRSSAATSARSAAAPRRSSCAPAPPPASAGPAHAGRDALGAHARAAGMLQQAGRAACERGAQLTSAATLGGGEVGGQALVVFGLLARVRAQPRKFVQQLVVRLAACRRTRASAPEPPDASAGAGAGARAPWPSSPASR